MQHDTITLKARRASTERTLNCFHAAVSMLDKEPAADSASASSNAVCTVTLRLAAAAGVVHGLFSLYWAMGGERLLASLGQALVETFADSRWVLFPVGTVKIIAALLPLVLARWEWPAPLLSRSICWAGAIGLALWGGANTIVGNLVLLGLIIPEDGYDHAGMVGHAWLWDPLFLIWGVSLALALVSSAQRRS